MNCLLQLSRGEKRKYALVNENTQTKKDFCSKLLLL
jgi:hypothetical protein